jgi:LmbE family N-acetylglucosaminyl deacetylase
MKVLAIAAHPDDETLGCGGTLLKHRKAGDELYWLVVTRAQTPEWPEETLKRKADEVRQVGEAYGAERVFELGLPTTKLDAMPQVELINNIRTVVDEVKPGIVFVTHEGDVHGDHRAVFGATMSVLKPFYMAQLGVHRVLSYETLSSTDAAPNTPGRTFLPTVFSDITDYCDQKLEIMSLYQTEIHPDPMPRGPSAIRAQARYRGAAIGVEYAEAFTLIRELV